MENQLKKPIGSKEIEKTGGWRYSVYAKSSEIGTTFSLKMDKEIWAINAMGGYIWGEPIVGASLSLNPKWKTLGFLISATIAIDEGLRHLFRIPYGDITLGFNWNVLSSSIGKVDIGCMLMNEYPIGMLFNPYLSIGNKKIQITYVPEINFYDYSQFQGEQKSKETLGTASKVAVSAHRFIFVFDLIPYLNLKSTFVKGYTTDADVQTRTPIINFLGGTFFGGLAGNITQLPEGITYSIGFNISWEEKKYTIAAEKRFESLEKPKYDITSASISLKEEVDMALCRNLSYDDFIKNFEAYSKEDKIAIASVLTHLVQKNYHLESEIWEVGPRETYNRLVESKKLGAPIGAHVCAGAARLAKDFLQKNGIEAHVVSLHTSLPHAVAYARIGKTAYLIDYEKIYKVENGTLFDLLHAYAKSGGVQYVVTVDGKRVVTRDGKLLMESLETTTEPKLNKLIK